MTDPRFTKLAAMKGNDLKVLVAMGLLGGVNIGNVAIKKCCKLHLTTIKNCLINLSADGFVTKTHRTDGWQITEGGKQMLLPAEPSRISYDSETIINIDTPLNTLRIKDSNNTNSNPSTKKYDSDIVKALHKIGIYDPKAVDLACLAHMTHDYISSWGSALEAGLVGKGGKDVPLVIHLMAQKAPAPIPEEEGWKKYVEGEYSDFIEH